MGLDRTVSITTTVGETQTAETVGSERSKQDQNGKGTGISAVEIVANLVPQIVWKRQQRVNEVNEDNKHRVATDDTNQKC